MKKILILSATALCSSLFSQIKWKETSFGLKGGLNYSKVSNAHNPSGPRYAFQGGALALIPIGDEKQFYIQPELSYYGAGETGKEKGKSGDRYNGVYANSYISVPLFFKAYFSEAESEFFALVGPRFNFLVGQNVKNPSKPYYITEQLPQYPGINGKANSIGTAVGIGLGYSHKRNLEISGQLDYGLNNTYPNLLREPGNDKAIGSKKRQIVVGVGLSYLFNQSAKANNP